MKLYLTHAFVGFAAFFMPATVVSQDIPALVSQNVLLVKAFATPANWALVKTHLDDLKATKLMEEVNAAGDGDILAHMEGKKLNNVDLGQALKKISEIHVLGKPIKYWISENIVEIEQDIVKAFIEALKDYPDLTVGQMVNNIEKKHRPSGSSAPRLSNFWHWIIH